MMMELVIEAGQVPEGSIVRKTQGSVLHVVKKEVRIYGLSDESRSVYAEEGVVFLVNSERADAAINAFPAHHKVVWQLHEDQLREWLNQRADERGSK